MVKTQKPTIGGVLTIVAGAFLILLAILIASSGQGVATLTGLLSLAIVLATVATVGGIFAIKRWVWELSLAGAICTLPVILGIPAIVLLVLSRSEFKRVSGKGRIVLYASLSVVLLVAALAVRSAIPRSEVEVAPASTVSFTPPESATTEVVTFTTGTVATIGDLRIGLGSIHRADYVDSDGVKQHGLVARLSTFVRDSKINVALQVYPGLIVAVDRYVIYVDEIEFSGTPSLLAPPGAPYGSIRLSVYTLTAPISLPAIHSSMSGDLLVSVNGPAGGISGANVVSRAQPEGQTSVSGFTDITGDVTFNGIKAGKYQFAISCSGYRTRVVEINFIPEVTRNISVILEKS